MLVTDAIGIEQNRGTAWIAAAVRGGVGIIQLRDRAASADELLSRARALRRVFPDVCLLVNSQIEAAAASGADGVQLGVGSPPVSEARRVLGAKALVGCSVHSIEEAAVAAAGTDFLVVGTMYVTASHPGKAPVGPGLLSAVAAVVSVPLYAIGGITAENAGECAARGAHGVAVIRAIAEAADPERAARELASALTQTEEGPDRRKTRAGPAGRKREAMIEVTINGDRRQVDGGQTLAEFLTGLRLEPRVVVVERNGVIVARDRLAETPVQEGDTLEIVQMMAGG